MVGEKTNLLAEYLILEAAFSSSHGIKKSAEGSGLSSVFDTVKNYIASKFRKDQPISSVIAFMGPGMLSALGLGWVAVIYEVMDALGFDWTSFLHSIGAKIESLVHSDTGASESSVHEAVMDTIADHFTNKADETKLQQLDQKGMFSESLYETLAIKKFAQRLQGKDIKKIAGLIPNVIKRKLVRKMGPILTFIIVSILAALGYNLAGGLVSHLLGTKQKTTSPSGSSEEGEAASTVSAPDISQKTIKLTINPNLDPDITKVHPNDMNNIWMEQGSINNISDIVASWAVEAYPQLTNAKQALKSMPAFESIVQTIENRNSQAKSLNMFVIPKPWETKIQIINTFVQTIKDASDLA